MHLMVIHNILKFQNHNLKIEREIASEVKTHAHAYLGNEDKNKKSGRTMTLTAVKLIRVQIFASIGKVIATKNGPKGNVHVRPPSRPPDRPTTDRPTPDNRRPTDARNHDSNTPLGFQPEG